MMLYEEATGVLRFYEEGSADMGPFTAICQVTRLDSHTAVLWGAMGKILRKDWRQVLSFLAERGARTVLARRGGRHRIPMSKESSIPDWVQLDIQELKTRFDAKEEK